MRNLNLENSGFTEMSKTDVINVGGGKKVPYLSYSWTDTDNELIYTFQAVANGAKLIGNGGIAIWNAFQ